MKKTIYKLFVLFALVIFGCTTDSVEQHETAAEIAKEKVLETTKATSEDTPKNTKTSTSNSSRTNTANNNSSQQTGRKGFGDGDGNIYDGTNNNDSPDGYEFNYTVTFNAGISETQKQELRIPYQISGELLYFEQCPNNPQKEIWYMVFNTTTSDCSTITFPDGSQVNSCPENVMNSDAANPPRNNQSLRNVSIVNMLPLNNQNNCD